MTDTRIKGFAAAYLAIRDLRVLTAVEVAVLIAILGRCNFMKSRICCWPTYRVLAADARLSERATIRGVSSLIKQGWVRRERRGRQSNLYYPDLEKIEAAAASARAERAANKRAAADNTDNDTAVDSTTEGWN